MNMCPQDLVSFRLMYSKLFIRTLHNLYSISGTKQKQKQKNANQTIWYNANAKPIERDQPSV
jgi:hypothetical protein